MKACRLLKEYAQYVEQVRRFAREMTFEEAVEKAVDHCIKNDILADFLSKNRAEAIAVSIFEYNEEQHLKSEWEAGRRTGQEEGIRALIEVSIEFGSTRQETLKRIMEKIRLPQETAKNYIDKYWHE